MLVHLKWWKLFFIFSMQVLWWAWLNFNILLITLKVLEMIQIRLLENKIFKLQIFIKIFGFWIMFSRRIFINKTFIQIYQVLYLTIFYLLVFLLDFIENNYFIILFFTQYFFWLFFWNLNIFILSLNSICCGSDNFQRTTWSNLINHFNSVLSIVNIFFLFKIILICLLG